MATDLETLEWLRDRLVHVYHESPNVDFVLRLEKVIENIKKAEAEAQEMVDVLVECDSIMSLLYHREGDKITVQSKHDLGQVLPKVMRYSR